MKKKILVVLLAMVMVFAFSAAAMAAAAPVLSVNGTAVPSTGLDISSAGTVNIKADSITGATATSIDKIEVSGDATATANADNVNVALAAGENELTVVVNYNTNLTATANIILYVGDNDARLTNLTVTSPSVHSNLSIPASVAGNYDTEQIAISVNSAASSIALASTQPNATVAATTNLTTASTTIPVKVKAENGREKTYNVVVTKNYDLATITGLHFDDQDITKSPNASGVIKYTYNYGTDTLKVTLKGLAPGATFEIDDEDGADIDWDEDDGYFEIDLSDGGDYDIDFTVYSASNLNSTEYTLELTEGESVLLDGLDIVIADSREDDETDFTMFPGKFDEETFNYYVFVPYDNDNLKTNAYAFLTVDFDSDYTVKVNGSSLTQRNNVFNSRLTVGGRTEYTIVVTNDDNISSTYKVYVYYASRNADDDDAVLNGISVKYKDSKKKLVAATLSPAFAAATKDYSVALPVGTTEAEIAIKAKSSENILAIICNDVKLDSTTSETIKATGLKAGANVYEIVLIGENCEVVGTYKVTLNVGAVAGLSNLVFNFGNTAYFSAPTFKTDLYNYVSAVPNSISSVTVTPTANDTGANITIKNGATVITSTGKSGVAQAVALNEGLNEVKVTVGSTTYVLNVYRQPAATPVYQLTKQSLSINGVAKSFNAVNINGNNFVRLRDIASAFNGSAKQFNVVYTGSDNTAAMTALTAYVPDAANPDNQAVNFVNPQPSAQTLTFNGQQVQVVAYNIGGSNYVNLRQISALIDAQVNYNAVSKAISINTSSPYNAYQSN